MSFSKLRLILLIYASPAKLNTRHIQNISTTNTQYCWPALHHSSL